MKNEETKEEKKSNLIKWDAFKKTVYLTISIFLEASFSHTQKKKKNKAGFFWTKLCRSRNQIVCALKHSIFWEQQATLLHRRANRQLDLGKPVVQVQLNNSSAHSHEPCRNLYLSRATLLVDNMGQSCQKYYWKPHDSPARYFSSLTLQIRA